MNYSTKYTGTSEKRAAQVDSLVLKYYRLFVATPAAVAILANLSQHLAPARTSAQRRLAICFFSWLERATAG